MSSGEWYYAVSGQQRGPVAFEALRAMAASRQLQSQDLVWSPGMANWQSASSIEGLIVPGAPANPPGYAPAYAQAPATGTIGYYTPEHLGVHFAGFWIRFGAAILDGLILYGINLVPHVSFRAVFGLDPNPWVPQQGPPGPELGAMLLVTLVQMIIGWLYDALQESSVHQATFGKRACGLRVTDLNGQRISFARATGRHFAEILSAITLFIGYMMAGWTERKQALHDIIAGTYVVRE
jgi:uncharacterized RDD family membrane protein YckC